MKPKKAEKIRVWETRLIIATFRKNREETAKCMDALHRRGCHEGKAMEAARNFMRQSQN